MTEETVFDSESTKTTAEVAALLHHLGDSLRDASTLSFEQDDETTTITVPPELSVAVEVERETDDDGREETEVEIELEWEAGEVEETEGAKETEAEAETEAESKGTEAAERPPELAPIADSLDPGETPRASLGRFEVFRDRADEWRWRLVHRNGNIIATSGEGYTSRQNAEKGLRSVMTNAPGADVTTGER